MLILIREAKSWLEKEASTQRISWKSLFIHWKRQKDPALHSIKGKFPHTPLLHQQDVRRENGYKYSQYGQPWNWASKAYSMHSSDSEAASFPHPPANQKSESENSV